MLYVPTPPEVTFVGASGVLLVTAGRAQVGQQTANILDIHLRALRRETPYSAPLTTTDNAQSDRLHVIAYRKCDPVEHVYEISLQTGLNVCHEKFGRNYLYFLDNTNWKAKRKGASCKHA